MELKNWGFCDVSLNKTYDLNKLSVIEKLGFNTIAINTLIEELNEEPKRKKRRSDPKEKGEKDKVYFIPPPIEIPQDVKDTCKLNILQRLTLEFSDTNISHKINKSENIKKYDIVAVLPKTLQAFQYACSSLDIDMITFNPESKISFKVNRKLYRQAVERNVFFELMYSPAIKGSTVRKNIISTAHTYHAIGKSRNIVLTSGADNDTLVRGVHDVINLGFILGLNSNESLKVIRDNVRKLIIRAQARRIGKYVMVATPIEECNQNKTDDE